MGMGKNTYKVTHAALRVWVAICIGVLFVSAYVLTDALVYDGKLVLSQTLLPSQQCFGGQDTDALVTGYYQ